MDIVGDLVGQRQERRAWDMMQKDKNEMEMGMVAVSGRERRGEGENTMKLCS